MADCLYCSFFYNDSPVFVDNFLFYYGSLSISIIIVFHRIIFVATKY